jgi:hypothetical protein
MKAAIAARLKLEVTLRFLAMGIPFHHLPYYLEFHHAPFQDFVPETLQSIINALGSFVNLCMTKLLLNY